MSPDIVNLADEILGINVGIRYVGIVDANYRVLASRMRAGLETLTTEQADRDYISIMPPIIVDAVEKLENSLGRMDAVMVRFEKGLLAFYRVKDMVIVLSFGPGVVTPFLSEIGAKIRKVANEYV